MSAWRRGTIVEARPESATGRTLRIRLDSPVRAVPGQRIDVRLTAADGYQAVRPYSLSDILGPDLLEISVEEVLDGEVSPYLVRVAEPGDALEARGPVGEWFTWDPSVAEPVQLIAGGSGVVPLACMVRAHRAAGATTAMRLLYSVRSPAMAYYRDEFRGAEGAQGGDGVRIVHVYTRDAPVGYDRSVGRLTEEVIRETAIPALERPRVYVCGPDGFVDAVTDALVALGHEHGRIRTERFG